MGRNIPDASFPLPASIVENMKKTLLSIILIGMMTCLCSSNANAQKWSISTNLLDYVNFGTINADVGLSVNKHWTISLSGKYNPFYFNFPDNPIINKKGMAAFNARFWPFFVYSGLFYGFGAQCGVYRNGGIFSDYTREGLAGGFTFEIGYSLILTKHLNIEFGIGVWAGANRFKMYSSTQCGRKISEGTKPFLTFNDLQINLLYNF